MFTFESLIGLYEGMMLFIGRPPISTLVLVSLGQLKLQTLADRLAFLHLSS